MTVHYDNIKLQGGLSLIEPALSTPNGEVIAAFNYEADQEGGYSWAKGYVPFDGAADVLANGDFYTDTDWTFGAGWAHDADTQELVATAATGNATKPISINAGKIYHVRVIIREITAGSVRVQIGSSITAAYTLAGEYEVEFVGSVATDVVVIPFTGFTGIIDSIHIMPIVPGSGNVLGACIYNGDTYAFRNNGTNTAAVMHKSSALGWVQVDLGSYIKFDSGTAVFTIGGTLTGGTSGETGVIEDFYVVSGAWGGTAAGYIALSGVSGTFGVAETITDGSGGSATSNGADVTNALLPDGRYEFVVDNIFGTVDYKAMFFVNGEGDAYQFVRGGLLPMEHGVLANPTHIGQYEKHIMLGFDEGAFVFSELGKPLAWDATLTAGQYSVGDKVNGFKTLPTAFLIVCESNTYVLYGTSQSTFDLTEFEDQAGGVKYSIQNISTVFFVNHSGLVDFRAVQDYGNFSDAAISKKVKPYITARVADVVCSSVHHGKTQYRVFFDDRTALYATFAGRKLIGFMPITLQDQPWCIYNGRDVLNNEYTVMGSNDGKVFKMDAGNLFNGRKIEAKLKLAYDHMGRPAQKKRVRKGDLYVTSDIGAKLKISLDYNYGSINRSSMAEVDIEQITGAAALWDVSVWDEFIWDSTGDPRLEIPLDGSGIAVSMTIYNPGMLQGDHRVDSLVYHYTPRGRNR